MTLPNPKWSAAGKQLILKSDFINIESAITGQVESRLNPFYAWVDAATLTVVASVDSPASMKLDGFPNVLNPNTQISGGITDRVERSNIADVSMFIAAGGLYGNEKASQLYALFAKAADVDTTFTIKAMPFMAVKSQAGQVISLGTLVTPATGIGYGFATDLLVGSMVYVLSGASRGSLRTITANNNDGSTGGTVTYSGTALTLAQGDIFIVFPPGVNFRYIGCFFNNSSSNIVDAMAQPNSATFAVAGTYLWLFLTPVNSIRATAVGGGGGGGGHYESHSGGVGSGGHVGIVRVSYAPGALLTVIVGSGGGGGGEGSDGSTGDQTKLNGTLIGDGGNGGGGATADSNGLNGIPSFINVGPYGTGGGEGGSGVDGMLSFDC